MIDFDKIKTAIQLIAININTTIIRAEQEVLKQTYPYGVYKIVSGQQSVGVDKLVENLTLEKITIQTTRIQKSVVSLTFLTNGQIGGVWDLSYSAIKYLESIDGLEAFSALEMSVKHNGAITDRTAFIEPVYEYRVGFDLNMMYNKVEEIEHDVIDVPLTIAGKTTEYI